MEMYPVFQDRIARRLKSNIKVSKEVATVINSPTHEHHGRIIAAKYEIDGATRHDYTWLPVTTSDVFPGDHIPDIPYREGGSLLYDETVAYYNALPNWLPQREITLTHETAVRPKFFYGLKVSNFDTGELTTDTATDPMEIDGYRERRRDILHHLMYGWHGTRFIDLMNARNITSTATDYRIAAWVQLLENWIYGATCVCNDLTGTDNDILRGVVNFTFEDFYDNIQTGDLIAERLGTSRTTGIQGSNFFYLKREPTDDNPNMLRLRYTPAIRKAPQYSKEWTTHLLARGYTYMNIRGIPQHDTFLNW